MRYKYIPNCSIIDYKALKVKFRFDTNGEFETEDPKLIDWIRKNKNFLKPVQEPKNPKPEIKKLIPEKPAKEEKKKLYKCKKCDFTTENMGELLAHYRAIHPKGE